VVAVAVVAGDVVVAVVLPLLYPDVVVVAAEVTVYVYVDVEIAVAVIVVVYD
jgi:hypothetical protein